MNSETMVGDAAPNMQDKTARWARIPQALRDRPQWCITPGTDADKGPRQTSGAHASSTNPSTWTDFDSACAAAAERGWHIGYVFTADDPFSCIDVDVKEDTSPEQMQRFQSIVDHFASYSEFSRSGKGMHVLVRANIGAGCKREHVEVYSQGRFLICTGNVYRDGPLEDRQDMLANMVSQMRGTEHPTTPLVDEPQRETDDAIIERAMRATNAEKFIALARGEWQGKPEYPSQSEADFALLSILTFYSPNNEQVRRIFRMTELGKREKASKDDRYLNLSLAALRARQAAEKQRAAAIQIQMPALQAAVDDELAKQRFKFKQIGKGKGNLRDLMPPKMDIDMMRASLVQVIDKNVYVAFRDKPDLYTTEAGMRAMLAHNRTTILTSSGKEKSIPIFDLWLTDWGRSQVHTFTFDPNEGECCYDPKGKYALNSWRARPHSAPADWQERVKAFVEHVAFLVPNTDERERFMDWLAHIEQQPGKLPHQHYLMIATVQGVGRNWLAAVCAYVWRGHVALDFDLKSTLQNGFNGQLSQSLIAVVDEIREGGAGANWANSNKLKNIVTVRERFINAKYGAQFSELNCCRWLLFSNYESALPLEDTDRRWNIVRNPSERHPGGEAYYTRLYDMLDDELFIASVREYLLRRDLTRFNPGAPALLNDAKRAVIGMSLSEEDQRARELKETHPRELIYAREVFQYVYGEIPDTSSEASSRWKLLGSIIERAGIEKHQKEVLVHGKRTKVWILRNPQQWHGATPEQMCAELNRS